MHINGGLPLPISSPIAKCLEWNSTCFVAMEDLTIEICKLLSEISRCYECAEPHCGYETFLTIDCIYVCKFMNSLNTKSLLNKYINYFKAACSFLKGAFAFTCRMHHFFMFKKCF